jgi:Zinc knuckle
VASQSRVREEEDFEEAYMTLDSVKLWELIRRIHLTHIFGDGDPMREVNVQEQETRFAALRQGEREYISTFKLRFDNQVKANEGAGVPEMTESKLALEFIMKLDPKRYQRMLAQMRNDALRKDADAYPKTLASAYRIASGWANEDPGVGSSSLDNRSAFLADTAFVTKARDPEKGGKAAVSKGKKPAEIMCFVCGIVGHYARDCEKRKGGEKSEKALVATAVQEDEVEEERDEWDLALVTSSEHALFSKHEVVLDKEASISVFQNKELLTGVRRAEKNVLLGGIQRGAAGVRVTEEGIYRDVGIVYYSDLASANILSFASQIDADRRWSRHLVRQSQRPIRDDTGTPTILEGRKSLGAKEGFMCAIRGLW